mmetsp:Transcript_17596/g.12544  ORF Transcript_17596/g.12544 Transcript_17596/m.12544 type:complete len:95 (+) Transcript_17596:53-337(+)
MALKELTKLCDSACQFGLRGIAIYHRLGVVPVGEASVMIVAVSSHRKAAIEAAAWAIDELKAKVPIWKKEVYEGEGAEWKKNAEFAKLKEKSDY